MRLFRWDCLLCSFVIFSVELINMIRNWSRFLNNNFISYSRLFCERAARPQIGWINDYYCVFFRNVSQPIIIECWTYISLLKKRTDVLYSFNRRCSHTRLSSSLKNHRLAAARKVMGISVSGGRLGDKSYDGLRTRLDADNETENTFITVRKKHTFFFSYFSSVSVWTSTLSSICDDMNLKLMSRKCTNNASKCNHLFPVFSSCFLAAAVVAGSWLAAPAVAVRCFHMLRTTQLLSTMLSMQPHQSKLSFQQCYCFSYVHWSPMSVADASQNFRRNAKFSFAWSFLENLCKVFFRHKNSLISHNFHFIL